jgi:hypothetical protein
MFPTWNETVGIQVLIACAIPLPPLILGPWRYKGKMATPEQKALCMLKIAKHESVFSLQQTFRRQFQSDLPSANSIRRWHQEFQTMGAFVKGKVQDVRVCQKKMWNESRQLFFAVRRNPCAMRVVNWRCRLWLCGGRCERDWKWSLIFFTWCSYFNHFGTRFIHEESHPAVWATIQDHRRRIMTSS